MATSESDDFESADEELGHNMAKRDRTNQWFSPSVVDSESDDDAESVQRNSGFREKREEPRTVATDAPTAQETTAQNVKEHVVTADDRKHVPKTEENSDRVEDTIKSNVETSAITEALSSESVDTQERSIKQRATDEIRAKDGSQSTTSKSEGKDKARVQRRPMESRQFGAKRLGTRIVKDNMTEHIPINTGETDNVEVRLSHDKVKGSTQEHLDRPSVGLSDKDSETNRLSDNKITNESLSSCTALANSDELTEMDMPEELKSNKTFKEVFQPQGWEGLAEDIELPDDLSEEKLQPILSRLSLATQESDNSAGNWGSWGGWGVSSFINTATAGVSTLTSRVSHGLTLLEESMGVPDPADLAAEKQTEEPMPDERKSDEIVANQPKSTFGFSNLISGVSTITKLVESTGSKVMSGGLDTLEAIGKKTMEVLQEGDPGLKKKRAFFSNDADKPILSQILREAKEKADAEERTLEEKQLKRKIHFESLFDDYQGLVHLEALEMLSKQSDIKIQQYLITLGTNELASAQETLEEVKELCDLGDEDAEEDEETHKELKSRLADACQDLGVSISYEKLCGVWEETTAYLKPPLTHTHPEIYQCAISTIAQFTALSVERFHKTAELLLVKERRSTVNEADALVQLTHILSNQISMLATAFCNALNELSKTSEKSNEINANITTIFLEATNASSYVQDAFRLLIPVLQVGAI